MIRCHTVAVTALLCIAVLLASQTSAHALCLYGCWHVLAQRVIVIDTTAHHPIAARPVVPTRSVGTRSLGPCPSGGYHVPGMRTSNNRLKCAKCGRFIRG